MSAQYKIDYAKAFHGAYWFDVVPRSVACPSLSPLVLLHAGPPLRGRLPASVHHAAVQALLFEALAIDDAQARAMLADGRVQLQPAQDHGVVTPLAMVVSASMLLVAVKLRDVVCFAPVIEGPAPALRFGSTAPECRQRLQAASTWVQATIAPVVRQCPVAIDAVIDAALALGDDCHARTGAANDALVAHLAALDTESAATLRANPGFVLTILMAAAAAALGAQRHGIKAVGGNGIEFGVRYHGSHTWRQRPATAPQGMRFAGLDTATPLAAIGDSAVIDLCGLGGQALSAAPLLVADWATWLPSEVAERRQAIIDPHTGMVDPERVISTGQTPLINLAILDESGTAGLIGRGFYMPAIAIFSHAAENNCQQDDIA